MFDWSDYAHGLSYLTVSTSISLHCQSSSQIQHVLCFFSTASSGNASGSTLHCVTRGSAARHRTLHRKAPSGLHFGSSLRSESNSSLRDSVSNPIISKNDHASRPTKEINTIPSNSVQIWVLRQDSRWEMNQLGTNHWHCQLVSGGTWGIWIKSFN